MASRNLVQVASLLLVLQCLASAQAFRLDTNKNVEEEKIWNGIAASRSYPFYAAIMYQQEPNSDWKIYCGGSLIDSKTVLTAAHCTDGFSSSPFKFEAWLGATNLKEQPPQRIKIVNGIKVENYIPPNDGAPAPYNDIGVYVLEQTAVLNDQVNTICLGTFSSYDDIPVALIGFGNTDCRNNLVTSDTLLYAKGKSVSSDKCTTTNWDPSTAGEICAILEDPTGGSNNAEQGRGDSGGPLFTTNGDNFAQVGLVSYNYPHPQTSCPIPELPGVYTIASHKYYEDFIRKNSNAVYCQIS